MSDWRELPAGEDLDALIAKRLGLDVHHADETGPVEVFHERDAAFGWHYGWYYIDPDPQRMNSFIPDYSTDLNAAFTLIKAIDGFALYVDAFWAGYGTPFTACIPDGDDSYRCEVADSPSLAICRAWLAYTDAKEKVGK